LIDFDTAQKCEDRDLLLQESEILMERLEDPSGREAEVFFEMCKAGIKACFCQT
jgi:hypothetical protein